MTYNAPTNLDLSGCTFSGDGGKTTVTGAQVIQNQNTQATTIANASQDASTAKTTSTSASQAATQAASDASSALTTANAAIPKSMIQDSTSDQIVGMKNGTVGLATSPFSGGIYGQGTMTAWNSIIGQGTTDLININPGGVRGGFAFWDIGSGTAAVNGTVPDQTAWGARIDSSWGMFTIGRAASTSTIWSGRKNAANWQFINFYTATNSYLVNGDETNVNSGDAAIVARGGDGTAQNAEITLRAGSLTSDNDGVTDLGSSSHRFNNLYLAGTVNTTSDANEKTVIGKVTDSSYADSSKLLSLYNVLTPVVYKYNTAVADKGADARYHIGNIAQDVSAAITGAGLTPSDWSIWSEEALTEQVQTPVVTTKNVDSVDPTTGATVTKQVSETTYTYETKPILDGNGQPRTRQALNYTELLMLYAACSQAAMTALTARVAALETKAAGGNA